MQMQETKIKHIEKLFLEFFPLYYQKFSPIFREWDDSGLNCTKNQKRAIMMIHNYSGITATELGQCMDMRKGSLTTLLDSLEEMGLVERKPDDEDRRKVLLFLRPEGKIYFDSMMVRHEAVFFEMFTKLTEEEIDQCLAGMKNVVAAIKKI